MLRKFRSIYIIFGFCFLLTRCGDSTVGTGFTTTNDNSTNVTTSPVLDSVSGAVLAYGLRKMRNGYTGNCIEVRRDSDNALADIGFDGDDLDEAALATHLGGANGFVRTWYNQSTSGGFDAVQTNNADQPQIVLSSTPGGKATLVFTDNEHFNTVAASGLTGNVDFSIISVSRFSAVSSQNYSGWVGWGNNTSGQALFFGQDSNSISSNYAGFFGGGVTFTNPATITDFKIFAWTRDSASGTNDTQTGHSIFIDGVSTTTTPALGATAVNLAATVYTIGGSGENSLDRPIDGSISEILLYPSTLSISNRSTIESSQTAYYW